MLTRLMLLMASELLDKGFLAPATVMAGSVLEEHLRKMALKLQVSIVGEKGRPKSVEVLSVDLRKAGAITEVQRTIDGVRDFVARHPA